MKIKQFRMYTDFEKEEIWLNEMAAKGWNLESYTWGFYTFKKGTPGEWTYRIELLNNLPGHIESREYIEFLEEARVEFIDAHLRWVYFRKRTADGPFTLYTDIDSKLMHYRRIMLLFGVFGFLNFLIPTLNLLGHGNYFFIYWLNYPVAIVLGRFTVQYWLKSRKLQREKMVRE